MGEVSGRELEHFGSYRILGPVGAGGMATIHRARQVGIRGFERTVALKRLFPALADRPDILSMFVREASLASNLQHPNIVQIFELGEVDGTYFISMEYIDGWSLSQVIRQARRTPAQRVPIEITLTLLVQLCDALDYAHNAKDDAGNPLQLIHRDISPANVLVSRTGHLKVIDFGIAHVGREAAAGSDEFLRGKFGYLAPELLLGAGPSPSSDIFAVGVVAHELVTGERLFCADSDAETLERLLYSTPAPPSAKNRDCPDSLSRVICQAVEREPLVRPNSAGALRDWFDSVRAEHGLAATSAEISAWLGRTFAQVNSPGRRRSPRFPAGTHAPFDDLETPADRQAAAYYADLMLEDDPSHVSEVESSSASRAAVIANSVAIAPNSVATREIRSGRHIAIQDHELPKKTHTRRNRLLALLLLTSAVTAAVGTVTYRASQSQVSTAIATTAINVAVNPSDAIIVIAGHPPLAQGLIELEPGIYSIQIERDGYQSWFSTIELDEGQRRTVSVSLIALKTEAEEPRVSLSPSERGLGIEVDGTRLTETTPTTFRLPVGKHRIAILDEDGDELWRTSIDARTDHHYEFAPTLENDRKERKRRKQPTGERPTARTPFAGEKAEPTPSLPAPSPSEPDSEPGIGLLGPTSDIVTDTLEANLPIPPPRRKVAPKPRIVRVSQVERLSGAFPRLRRHLLDSVRGSRSGALLVCVSKRGRVSSAKALNNKLPDKINRQLEKSMMSWRFRPFAENGVAVPVCFSQTFRLDKKQH